MPSSIIDMPLGVVQIIEKVFAMNGEDCKRILREIMDQAVAEPEEYFWLIALRAYSKWTEQLLPGQRRL